MEMIIYSLNILLDFLELEDDLFFFEWKCIWYYIDGSDVLWMYCVM